MPIRQHKRFRISIGRGIDRGYDLVVEVEFHPDLKAEDELMAVAHALFAAEVDYRIGNPEEDRHARVTALFRFSIKNNAEAFAGHALRCLCDIEDAEQEKQTEDRLALYRFERVFGPAVFLALHPTKRGDEAYAILAGNEIIEDDDVVNENELAEVSQDWAERTPVVVSGSAETLWQRFSSAQEPCYLAAAPNL